MSTGLTAAHSRHDGLVLRLLRDEGPQSRTRLSEDTGLSPTTISKVVAPLLEHGWVEEVNESHEVRIGRPAITLRQVPEAVSVCGIQLGVGVARVGIADGWARVRSSEVLTFDPARNVEDVLDEVGDLTTTMLRLDDGPPCIAVGVAAPGPVDRAHRVNLLSINLPWRDVPVADRLEARLRLPVTVDHNVRSMALAEARYGGHGVESMAYVYVKAGVGLGLVLKSEPFFGGYHGVSELGHIRVVDDGERCVCGAHGCLETVVSEPYLLRRLEALGVPPGESPDPAIMATLEAERGRPGIEALRRGLIANVARGLAAVINLLNPELILLGGTFADAPDSLVDDIRAALREEVFPLLRDEVRLGRPALKHAGISAGAALALETSIYAGGE